MADYVVQSKVKEFISKQGFNTAGDAIDGLDKVVEWQLKKACERAKENGRKTVRPIDF